MIQIIGKGGFGREVAAYCHNEVVTSFENESIVQAKTGIPTVVAIGDPLVRERIVRENNHLLWTVVKKGMTFDYSSLIGEGSIICPGTILTVNITIGKHVIINLNCTIGHHVVIGDFVTISPGANISGNVSIGDNCYIGSNAVIREGIYIGSDVIIGAGAVVVKHIHEPGTYVGNPVRKLEFPWTAQ